MENNMKIYQRLQIELPYDPIPVILFMGFSRQEYWSGLPFTSPVDHILSELSTMNCPSLWPFTKWLSFIELVKVVVHVIRLLVFCDCGFRVCLPSDAHCHRLPSYWGFSYLGRGVSLHIAPAKRSHCSSPWTWVISSLPLAAPAPCSHHSPLYIIKNIYHLSQEF